MCILCVASRWSRRIVTMLPWLVIPLLILWAISQLLPPSFRFEVTSPRLACVFVLLISIGWYEILLPRLSLWRARRSALMRERKRIEAQVAAKWRKEAIRRCRNCLTAYRDQNPGGGRFMCAYCGHLSRRPVLDIPGMTAGIAGPGIREDHWGSNLGTFRGAFGVGKCSAGESHSGIVIFIIRILAFSFFFLRWVWRRMWRVGSSDEGAALNAGYKAELIKDEDECNFHRNKGEKARRKAEEKRLARLEKKMIEEEERKQREEVARLVEERRRLRDEKLEAEKESEREAAAEREREIRREKEAGRRRQTKGRSMERVKGLGSDKLQADGEEVRKRMGNENEHQGKVDMKVETEKSKAPKAGTHNPTVPRKSFKSYRVPMSVTGFKPHEHVMKGGINGAAQVGASRYLGSKDSIQSPRSSALYTGNATLFCGKSSVVKSLKPAYSRDIFLSSNSSDIPVESVGLNSQESTNFVWNRTGWSKIWSKGSEIMYEDTCTKQPRVNNSNGYGDHTCIKAVKPTNSGIDRSPGIDYPQTPVGVELQPTSSVATETKSWKHLFTRPSTSYSTDFGSKPEQRKQAEVGGKSSPIQAAPCNLSDSSTWFGSPEPTQLAPAETVSTYSNSISVSSPAAESSDLSGFISPSACISSFTPAKSGNGSYEDSLCGLDAVSLLGPVSQSLSNFALDVGTSLLSDTRVKGVMSSGHAPISAPIHRPAHTESTMSKVSSSDIVDNLHVTGDQLPSIADLWSLPSLSLSGQNGGGEQGKWQMWDMPQLRTSEFGYPSPWFPPLQNNILDQDENMSQPFPQRTGQISAELESCLPDCLLSTHEGNSSSKEGSGDIKHMAYNLWLNQPDLKCTVGSWNELDGHQSPPSFAVCVTQGTVEHSFDAADGNACEQSPIPFCTKSGLQNGGDKNNCFTETVLGSTSCPKITKKSSTNIGGIEH